MNVPTICERERCSNHLVYTDKEAMEVYAQCGGVYCADCVTSQLTYVAPIGNVDDLFTFNQETLEKLWAYANARKTLRRKKK